MTLYGCRGDQNTVAMVVQRLCTWPCYLPPPFLLSMNLTSTMLSIMPILMEEGEKSAASGTACNSCDDACGCITIPKAVRMAKDRGLLPSDLSGPCILDKGVPGWILSARQSPSSASLPGDPHLSLMVHHSGLRMKIQREGNGRRMTRRWRIRPRSRS